MGAVSGLVQLVNLSRSQHTSERYPPGRHSPRASLRTQPLPVPIRNRQGPGSRQLSDHSATRQRATIRRLPWGSREPPRKRMVHPQRRKPKPSQSTKIAAVVSTSAVFRAPTGHALLTRLYGLQQHRSAPTQFGKLISAYEMLIEHLCPCRELELRPSRNEPRQPFWCPMTKRVPIYGRKIRAHTPNTAIAAWTDIQRQLEGTRDTL